MRQSCCHRFLMHAYWYESLVETQNLASHEQPIASLIHHKIPISNMQIKSGDAKSCVSTFLQHKFQSTILTTSSQCASLAATVFWCMHIGVDCSGDAKSCVSTFFHQQFQSAFLTTSSQRASLVVGVLFATRIMVEKKRHTTHRKLTENRVYPDNIYFASVYADFSAYA